jgi:uncharacterized membrane protein YdbT with pleckstrin-like domain
MDLPDPAVGPTRLPLPEGLVRPEERVILALKPSWAFVVLICAPLWMLLAAFLAAAWVVNHWQVFKLPMNWLVLAAVCLALVRLLVALVQWLARWYVLTDRRIIRVKGVLWVQVFECSLARIQNTALSLPLSQRALGAGTLYVSTAGTAGADPAWLVIARPAQVHQTVTAWIGRAQSPATSM